MSLPYLVRLLCLCFASFFVLNALVALVIHFVSKTAILFSETRPPGAAAGLLFVLRLLPLALATLSVAGLCIPSYLWLEPAATGERVGWVCAALGLLGTITWFLSILRAAEALLASRRHNRLCASAGQETIIPGDPSPVVVIENEAPLLVMSGLLHPRLLISRGVLAALSAEELDVALRHEHAHRTSRDNSKRLLFLLAPDLFPFIPTLRTLERNWSKFTEWAADDQATARDSVRALSLAAALVQVARMGAGPRLPALSTRLLAADLDLSARIARLLRAAQLTTARPARLTPAHTFPLRSPLPTAGLLVFSSLAALLLAPPVLSAVHELLELLLR